MKTGVTHAGQADTQFQAKYTADRRVAFQNELQQNFSPRTSDEPMGGTVHDLVTEAIRLEPPDFSDLEHRRVRPGAANLDPAMSSPAFLFRSAPAAKQDPAQAKR
jgi:hypothetical protein